MRAPVRLVVGRDGAAGRDDRVDAFAVLFGNDDIARAEVVFELLERARPDDGARDARLLLAPGEGELGERAALIGGDGFEPLDDVVDALGEAAALLGVEGVADRPRGGVGHGGSDRRAARRRAVPRG